MNKLLIILILLTTMFLTSCQDGIDGKAYMTFVWTDVSADTLFVSEDSRFPNGDSISTIMQGGSIICTVQTYNSPFDSLKGVEYEVYPGTFYYGTVTAGVVELRQMEITVNEGEEKKQGEILGIFPGSGEDGEDIYYTANLDKFTLVP